MAKDKANPPAAGGTEFPVKVDRNVYPRPEYRFPDVKVGMTYKDSVAADGTHAPPLNRGVRPHVSVRDRWSC